MCAVRVPVHFNQAARRLVDPGSRIWDPGSGKAGRGASGTWEGGTKGRTFDTIATIHPQQPPKEAYSSPTRIPKLPPTLGKGVGRRSPWKSLGRERKPSAKGVTPSVKGRTHSQKGVRFGKKGATPAEKGAIQRAEGHRSAAGVDGTSPGLGRTWQTKITKPPSKVRLSCPAAPLLVHPTPPIHPTRPTRASDSPDPLHPSDPCIRLPRSV